MKYIYLSFLFLFFGCNKIHKKELVGLWKLEDVKVDIIPQVVSPTFIQFNRDNSYAVAMRSKDQSGLYDLRADKIEFYSEGDQWFNVAWNVFYIENNLILEGIPFKYRGTKLRFTKIDEVPDFLEFEEMVIGKWKMYKIRSEGQPQSIDDTWFEVDSHGSYSIFDSTGELESGKIAFNSRHKKVIFESDSTIWNAWTFGRELRLQNDEFDVQYSLKR